MRVVPEAPALPKRKKAVKAGEEFRGLAVFRMNVFVKLQPLKFFRSFRSLSLAGLHRSVHGEEPLGERLALPPHFFETLRARYTPRFEMIKAGVAHHDFQIAKQGGEIIVKQVKTAESRQMTPEFEHRLGNNSELAHAAARDVKQIAIFSFRAAHDVARAGHHLEPPAVVDR